jgi:hypothetical protein
LLLLLIVGSVPAVKRNFAASWRSRLINGIAWVLAAVICWILWRDETVCGWLALLATNDVDRTFPPKFSLLDVRQYHASCRMFFLWSTFSAAMVVFNWASLRRLAGEWSVRTARRRLWAILVATGIGAVASYLIWLYVWGFWKICPHYAGMPAGSHPTHYWVALALSFFILITAMACPMAVDRSPTPNGPRLSWRRPGGHYYHECRLLLFGMAIAIICFRVCWSYELHHLDKFQYGIWSENARKFPWLQPVLLFAETFMFRPMDFLWAALIFQALFRAFGKRPAADSPQLDIPRINRAKFITLWLATAAFVITGALTLAWVNFGFWFCPWYFKKW